MAGTSADIHHDRANGCFLTEVDGNTARLDYDLDTGAGRLVVTHTGVPEAIGGRGIAAALMTALLEFARDERIKVVPACSYAAAFMRRHPQYADLLA
ncbi:GNAT family N-acetyltransferase [Stenotrophomonas sp. MMGLT7]|uniref:GNAT family N-acetyltransferase n=1 Tax=Stenotrophomonas sp. MMGLT7 TaxID=2901227 RepID=UPI001E657679|nr:GNAT family N-acetyltransferase [Stenotrophomonas sp. MMGLT7]MCD7098746.1 N-acetyltransferase [Stenotrophomonas sp. MMGLT7]